MAQIPRWSYRKIISVAINLSLFSPFCKNICSVFTEKVPNKRLLSAVFLHINLLQNFSRKFCPMKGGPANVPRHIVFLMGRPFLIEDDDNLGCLRGEEEKEEGKVLYHHRRRRQLPDQTNPLSRRYISDLFQTYSNFKTCSKLYNNFNPIFSHTYNAN